MPHGDFTLNPFSFRNDVSRVLWQQGRVHIDSDWNEHTAVILRALRTGIADILGPHGGPGFEILRVDGTKQFTIGFGHYYVDGIRVDNPARFAAAIPVQSIPKGEVIDKFGTMGRESIFENVRFDEHVAIGGVPGLLYHLQPNLPGLDEENHFDPAKRWIVYLDVWERHISAAEDDSLREVALLGPDTASRAVVVWQVRLLESQLETEFSLETAYRELHQYLDPKCAMRAKALDVDEDDQACIVAPDARYRGIENRLYRVEIHKVDGSNVWFKWSPDNGSIVYPVREVQGSTVTLESLGRDDRTSISIGDWVELVDEDVVLLPKSFDLAQVIDVDRSRMEVTVQQTTGPMNPIEQDQPRRPILRRWATKPVPIKLVADPNKPSDPPMTPWLHLGDGVNVQFAAPAGAARFRVGDYWLVPARVATGDVIWPRSGDTPIYVAPHGVEHHYAPLAVWDKTAFQNRRKAYKKLTEL